MSPALGKEERPCTACWPAQRLVGARLCLEALPGTLTSSAGTGSSPQEWRTSSLAGLLLYD